MLKLTDYGFTEEEASDIAFGLTLYNNWLEEFLAGEFFDERYTAAVKDFAEGIPFAQAIVTGFLGGLEKGFEVCLKLERAEKRKAALSDSNTESGKA